MKIAVLGSGGWGTALAMLLAENGHTVTLWSYLRRSPGGSSRPGRTPFCLA